MSESGQLDDDLTAAERGLSEHLELLRRHPPAATGGLVAGILTRVRWQTAIRDPLIFAGALSGALAEGLGLLIGPALSER